jgi:tetratricopeptide (TPR) repeat protein
MEEQVLHEDPSTQEIACANCASPYIEEGHALPLCMKCRDQLARRPVPVWIWGVFGITVLVLFFALTRFPATLQAGVAFERGQQAEQEGKYLTAMKEYRVAADKFSDSTLALGRLYITYYHNGKLQESEELLKKLGGRELDNKSLADEINAVTDRMQALYYPTQAFADLMNQNQEATPEKMVELLKPYVEQNPGDVTGAYYLADLYYEMKKYDEAGSIVTKLLETYPDFHTGSLFLAAVHRQKGEYDQGIALCRKVLEHNSEDVEAYISMSRIELKRHQDKQGLELALKAYELDSDNAHILASLSMAYHFNNMIKERDEMLELFKKHKGYNEYDMNQLSSIISGQLKWRE